MSSNRVLYVVGAIALAAVLLLAPVFFISGPNPVVEIETSKGTIRVELYRDKAPLTVENFLKYVNNKHYDGTVFHRVVNEGIGVVQGGGLDPSLTPRPTDFPPVKNEAGNGLRNDRGTIAMARTPDPDSATAQFFINTKSNPDFNRPPKEKYESLSQKLKDKNAGYTVFGRVIEGMEVVDTISKVEVMDVKDLGLTNVPEETVLIKSVKLIR